MHCSVHRHPHLTTSVRVSIYRDGETGKKQHTKTTHKKKNVHDANAKANAYAHATHATHATRTRRYEAMASARA